MCITLLQRKEKMLHFRQLLRAKFSSINFHMLLELYIILCYILYYRFYVCNVDQKASEDAVSMNQRQLVVCLSLGGNIVFQHILLLLWRCMGVSDMVEKIVQRC